MAWVEKRGNKWIGRYRAAGQTKTTSAFPRKGDAREAAEEQERRAKLGQWTDPKAGHITMAEWAPLWLGSLDVTPKTAHTYRELLDALILPRWGGTPLSGVHLSDVKRWVTTMKGKSGRPLSPSRRRAAGAQLVRMLDAAVDEGRLRSNSARTTSGKANYLPSATRQKDHRFLSHGELERLAAAAGALPPGDGRWGTLVRLTGLTGLRWGEVSALRVGDFDALRARLKVERAYSTVGGQKVLGATKTHERRTVRVPRSLVEPLAALCEGKGRSDLIFTTKSGTPLDNRNFATNVLTPAYEAAGVDRLTFHDLRHTAASLAVQAGASVKAVQTMLGHASATMTMDTYAGLFDTDADALADALDAARQEAVSADSAHYVPTRRDAAAAIPMARG